MGTRPLDGWPEVTNAPKQRLPDVDRDFLSRSAMAAFEPYVRSLESLANEGLQLGPDKALRERIAAALDGQPSTNLAKLVPLDQRQAAGAFFTGADLRERTVRPWAVRLPQSAIILDPACGAGDLLIASARHLPVAHNLATTLDDWGKRLHGFDLQSQFVRAAKARLVLVAIDRGVPRGRSPLPSLDRTFPNIGVGDGLVAIENTGPGSQIVLNPPYSKAPAPRDCLWGSGKVSMAAIFVDACVSKTPEGTRIVAILPDVLRTGSLYARWRAHIEARAAAERPEVYGQFDSSADVDVFLLRLVVGQSGNHKAVSWWSGTGPPASKRVGDYFDISVGPVVPHRHRKVGPCFPFVAARLLPHWGSFDVANAPRCRFPGRTFTPPFVLVRRTSAPSDKKRGMATLVVGSSNVAVENHLLVLSPRDKSIARCHELLQTLRADATDEWLNERIRCRHLTVDALRELPWRGLPNAR